MTKFFVMNEDMNSLKNEENFVKIIEKLEEKKIEK